MRWGLFITNKIVLAKACGSARVVVFRTCDDVVLFVLLRHGLSLAVQTWLAVAVTCVDALAMKQILFFYD